MAEYRCIKRLKTVDGVIHEIGTTVTLTGAEEQGALLQRAVVPIVVQDVQPAQPTIAQLQAEEKQLQDQIATMEHEGGAPSA